MAIPEIFKEELTIAFGKTRIKHELQGKNEIVLAKATLE